MIPHRAWPSSVLTVSESPRAATTLISAGRSSWTRETGKKMDGQWRSSFETINLARSLRFCSYATGSH